MMHELVEAQDACCERNIFRDLTELMCRRGEAEARLAILEQALGEAQEACALAADRANFCHDHLELPIRIFWETARVHAALLKAWESWTCHAETGATEMLAAAQAAIEHACACLREHLATRQAGDRDPKWSGWYAPWKRRPNGGFPELALLESIDFRD